MSRKQMERSSLTRSSRKHKKWKVRAPSGKWVHFGDSRYEDFTQHRDPERRRRYLARATAIRDKSGNLAYKDPEPPNYYAVRLLWKGP